MKTETETERMMKSQGVLMAIVVEGVVEVEAGVADVMSDVDHAVKVLAMMIIHLMGSARTKTERVVKSEDHNVVVAAIVDQGVTDVDQDVYLRALEMRQIATTERNHNATTEMNHNAR